MSGCEYVIYEFDNVDNFRNGIDTMTNNKTIFLSANSNKNHTLLVTKDVYDKVGNLPNSEVHCAVQNKISETSGWLKNFTTNNPTFITGSCSNNCNGNKISLYTRTQKL